MREIGKERSKKKAPVLKILILTTIFAIFLFAVIKLLHLDKHIFKGPQTVVQLLTDAGLKSDRGRTNVLLLGIGGFGHEGPDLSDTMILASIDKEGKDVALISIPRDLWAPSLGAKINSAYAYGQEKNGQGIKLAEETVSSLFGTPVHYAMRVDFDGFIKAVDLVGGLDINGENAFVDAHYPIAGKEDDLCGLTIEKQQKDGKDIEIVKDATGSATPLDQITPENDPFKCRYETLTFKKGSVHMDGKTALKFVRSRYGTNGEGSDFARSARQQKIILAFRERVLSSDTLTNPKKILELAKTFGNSIDTDITDNDTTLFAKLGSKIKPESIRRIVLDAGRDESVLTAGNPQDYGGQYALMPKDGWGNLDDYVLGEIFKLEGK